MTVLTPQQVENPAVFVTAAEGARRCMVGVETFRTWSSAGVIPKPAIDRGQIQRWHWPSVEAALAKHQEAREHDPFVEGVANVTWSPTETNATWSPKRRRSRGFAG